MRLKSLDIFRGLTVAFMILVNNGAGDEIYSALQHSRWNGLTPCDLVFPFFLFMVGMSTYLSLKKSNFKPTKSILSKIMRRTCLLFFIGIGINWFDMICNSNGLDFGHLRIWGVMQRIALCYGFVGILSITINHRYIIHVILGLLILYMGILAFGNGYAYDSTTNIIAQADLNIFGYEHLYHKSPVDPEGLLSTLPSIAHTLIGFWCCKNIQAPGQGIKSKIKFLKVAGLTMVGLGFFLSIIGFYINKRIWSPSYVFVTCGFAAWLLGILTQFTDHPGDYIGDNKQNSQESAFTKLWLSFGMNPLFLYVMSEMLSIVFGTFGIKEELYNVLHGIILNGYLASLAYALIYVAIHAAMGAWLYKQRLFIKI